MAILEQDAPTHQAEAKNIFNQDKANIILTKPGELQVIRRNGRLTRYDESKIAIAMTKAFNSVEGKNSETSPRIREIVNNLTTQITQSLKPKNSGGANISIEEIQERVEFALMCAQEYEVFRSYVSYRDKRQELRESRKKLSGEKPALRLKTDDGLLVPLDLEFIRNIINEASIGLNEVDPELVIKKIQRELYDGISIAELYKAMTLTTRALIETEPNYDFITSRLLHHQLSNEALSFLNLQTINTFDDIKLCYADYFKAFINRGVELSRLDPVLQQFDLDVMGKALKPERDRLFNYLGLQTLYDRYFIHSNNVRFELPQAFFMRIAMGLAIDEPEKERRAIEFYELISSFDYMCSTPTLFNSGTLRPQLSSCYLSTIPDDLDQIFAAIKDNALLSKYAGGLGNDWTPVRAMEAHIKGTNGKSLGPIPFMVVANATLVAVNQGGKRKGAGCAYLETFHKCIESFLELRKNTGDERRRTHDMNTANWIPDLFMKRVHQKANWTLFSPDETPELHDLYGHQFEQKYKEYEQKAKQGKIDNFKVISAQKLWRKMLSLLFETGHPWITFKDPCNLRSPQQHVGVVHSSNLCTEITLNTSVDEIAVCNLGSVNLPAHIDANGKLDNNKLQRTITTAIRMLDNVIDINYYSVPQARHSNMKHRPIGMGIMGFQEALYKLGISYTSEAAVEFADRSMETVSYHAIYASTLLAEERGHYATYEGSLWSKGILPIDSLELLAQTRSPEHFEVDRSKILDWDKLRERVRTIGMRNSNVMAIAPTATISNIIGTTQSIEPTFQNLYVKSNLSGEFTVVNPYLVRDLKALNLWDPVMVNDIKYYNGSIQAIDRIPDEIKQRYKTAFEIDPRWLIEAASRRQKWIDQAQSLNLYMAAPSGKKLDNLYRLAWVRGLKTTYYLRSMGASNAEKSTVDDASLNAVKTNQPIKACSIDDPDCEACQ